MEHPTRQSLLGNATVQMILVIIIVALANTWSAGSFLRLDLTQDRIYSLDLTTRALMVRLDKPLLVKVYFSQNLQAPYHNHEQTLIDTLEDLRAYSKGLMDIQVIDPTNVRELEEEAQRFGIQPIQYRYRSANLTEMKKVFMGAALVYGDQQKVLPAITQTQTLEYELAKAIKSLVSDEERKTIGWTTGFGEPDLLTGSGPLETLRTQLSESYNLARIPVGGSGLIDESVDALFVVGPQRPLSQRALYQLDQFLMRGGSLAFFVTHTKPDLRNYRPQNVYHGLEPLIGHYGVQVNRDLVVDRASNGVMRLPVRQGRYLVQMPVNYPLLPKANDLNKDNLIVKDLDSMLFPFVSSLSVADPLPDGITAQVLAKTGAASGRIKGVRTIDPNAFKLVDPGEERGPWPVLVSLSGSWTSFFANSDIPPAPNSEQSIEEDDPASQLRTGAQARLIVSGSADFLANNLTFMLNLSDWMAQDDSLVGIRSKMVDLPPLEHPEPKQAKVMKAANMLFGPLVMLLIGVLRWAARRRTAFAATHKNDAKPEVA